MRIDATRDVVSGADSDRQAIYIDKSIPQFSLRLTDKNGRRANLWKYLSIHEMREAADMAKGMSYEQAHKRATIAEKTAVITDGVDWTSYETEINGHLAKMRHKKATNPPPPDQQFAPHRAVRKKGQR